MSTSAPVGNMRLMYFGAIALCIVATLTGARGADKEGNGLKIGVVNLPKIASDYRYSTKADADLKSKQADIIVELNSWDQHRLLSEADQRVLGQIGVKDANKTQLTQEEQASKKRIEAASKTLFDEFQGLQQKQQSTPGETARLRELTHLDTETVKRIKDRQTSAQEELQKQANDARLKIDTDIKDAIHAVAKAKGFNLVFSSEVLLYCDNDLTDEVVKKLNK